MRTRVKGNRGRKAEKELWEGRKMDRSKSQSGKGKRTENKGEIRKIKEETEQDEQKKTQCL